ncbi:MAG: MaoC family dehydratase [Rhodocyclaceae bacterium]
MIRAGIGFDEIEPGEQLEYSMTLTETHLVLGAGLFGDINPLHVNSQFASASRFKGRIAHGYLTSSFMAAALGMAFHGTAIAYLEHRCRFTAPARPGDTLTAVWTLARKQAKPRHGGGIVHFEGICRNQDGTHLAEASASLLVENRRS